jgi:hypothetical protein
VVENLGIQFTPGPGVVHAITVSKAKDSVTSRHAAHISVQIFELGAYLGRYECEGSYLSVLFPETCSMETCLLKAGM